jgi:hypothetical protein
MSENSPTPKHRFDWIRTYALPTGIYLFATLLTDAYFMGDTPGYATSILAYEHGGSVGWDNPFWEFGHLLWRPIGHVVFHVLRPITSRIIGDNERLQLILALIAISWIAGLLCVVFFRRLLGHFVTGWIADVVGIGICFSNAFLNYSQTGCAYVSGLLLLILGMMFLVEVESSSQQRSALRAVGSACLAGSVCLWFPYILVIPVALLTPMILNDSFRFSRFLKAGILTASMIAVAYILVLAHLGTFTLAGFKQWVMSAGHGYNQTGIPRMVFGLARSFINMGDDGILFKRYLLHDPFNPVTLNQLIRASLWKLGVFYLTLAAAILGAARTAKGRCVILVFTLAAAPVLYFALFVFEGGMPERYMPLLPFLFLLFAVGATASSFRVAKYVVMIFVAVMAFSDVGAMSKWVLEKKQKAVAARIEELSTRLKPDSLVAATHLQDELTDFYYNYPFNPLNRRENLTVYNVLEPGASRILTWREDFAAKVQATWSRGGELWISKRFFAERPHSEWNWTEGDDPRISWKMLAPFFKGFAVTESIGGDDGFVLIPRSPANERLISALAEKSEIRR